MWLLLLFFMCLLTLNIVHCEDLSLDEVRKLSIKQLKKNLSEIGLECKGCAEKDDYVKLFYDNQNLPKVIKDEESDAGSSSDPRSKPDKEENIEEVSQWMICRY